MIVGVATASGQGGIAIVRLSGRGAPEAFSRVFFPRKAVAPYESHKLMLGQVMENGLPIDEAMGVVMYAPNSYTREDVCEIHTHGGDLAASQTVRLLIAQGARPALPGEFTKRAFLNGRIDLSQAEAVMGVIGARSALALRRETQQLEGGQSRFIKDAQDALVSLLSGLEAHLDYPDEISLEQAAADLGKGLAALIDKLTSAVDERSARLLSGGLRVALCGVPNAGKSTLFNALLCEERAIVTEIAGTTRDVLTGETQIGGVNVTLMDTAGLRQTTDQVEKIGVDRAKQAIGSADAVLLVLDASRAVKPDERELLASPPDAPMAVLLNKDDGETVLSAALIETMTSARPVISLSALTGQGVPQVREYLGTLCNLPDQLLLTHERHMAAAKEAIASLCQAQSALCDGQPIDLVGIDLQAALYALGRITGESVDEALIDDIFSRFCVGK